MAWRGDSHYRWQDDARTPACPVPVALTGLYGGDRIVAGTRFLDRIDPGWWQEGALLPASLTALNTADPYQCLLAWWAARHLPAPPDRGQRPAPPYDRAMLALGLSPRQAHALGFTGVDADLLTPGWRHVIIHLRESPDNHAAEPARRTGTRHAPRNEDAGAGDDRRFLWRSRWRPCAGVRRLRLQIAGRTRPAEISDPGRPPSRRRPGPRGSIR
jgi:hypothetical protein